MMFLSRLFGSRNKIKSVADELMASISSQARNPRFFSGRGFVDTMEGRIELVSLHAILVLRRLRAEGEDGRPVASELFKVLFSRFDYGLRETGVGDHSIARKMRVLAEGHMGRDRAYNGGLDDGANELHSALSRNLCDVVMDRDFFDGLTEYVLKASKQLDEQSSDALLQGRIEWPEPVMLLN
jgi:cytochrome b pre-mRNA-processing protein 3